MAFTFKSTIYKVGINPVVDVPKRITAKLLATKGYIPVKGTINGFSFHQTLCPVRNGLHRLYVNGLMLKGSEVEVGAKATFTIEQDDRPPKDEIAMPPVLANRLKQEKLLAVFNQQTPSRRKEVFRYLSSLKTEASLHRNIAKVVANLKNEGTGTPWIYKKR